MSKKLIHVAKYRPGKSPKYLFLWQEENHYYVWYIEDAWEQKKTSVLARTVESALQRANKTWKHLGFRHIHCGFTYSLPERDEHGSNALFCQMTASYGTPTGIYFDEQLGHNCFVQNASREALDIWRRLDKIE